MNLALCWHSALKLPLSVFGCWPLFVGSHVPEYCTETAVKFEV